jgi:hypothetical protein
VGGGVTRLERVGHKTEEQNVRRASSAGRGRHSCRCIRNDAGEEGVAVADAARYCRLVHSCRRQRKRHAHWHKLEFIEGWSVLCQHKYGLITTYEGFYGDWRVSEFSNFGHSWSQFQSFKLGLSFSFEN